MFTLSYCESLTDRTLGMITDTHQWSNVGQHIKMGDVMVGQEAICWVTHCPHRCTVIIDQQLVTNVASTDTECNFLCVLFLHTIYAESKSELVERASFGIKMATVHVWNEMCSKMFSYL